MRKTLAGAITLVMLLLPATAGAHDAARACGDDPEHGAGWTDLHAHDGIGCPHARRLADKWQNRQQTDNDSNHYRIDERRWHCLEDDIGDGFVRTRCTSRNGHRVHFEYGL